MSGKDKARRKLSAAEKVQILEEARAPKTTVAEVLRRHQLDATTFYRWEREAKAAMLAALGDRPRPRTRESDSDREIERLKHDIEKKSRIIAEVVEENLALKGGSRSAEIDALPGRSEGRAAAAGHTHAGADGVDGAPHSPSSGPLQGALPRLGPAGGSGCARGSSADRAVTG
jgi:transposase